ncbi:MAG: nitrous oxide reductase accessory protein NosL [Duodenibacillus sp.]|nr:nitrous oxide reductase accessory protein NosL [Duodenibacillus sp.]
MQYGPLSRRLIACAALSAAAVMLAACTDEKAEPSYAPRDVTEHDRCLLCGMVVSHYEGPKAEIWMKEVEDALVFCSARDAFTFALQPENGRRMKAMYVTDSARDIAAIKGKLPFVDARGGFYVYGSDFDGVMGPEPVPFAAQADAEAFAAGRGGKVLRYGEITLELLGH